MLAAAATALAFFALEKGAHHVLGAVVPVATQQGAGALALMVLMTLLFAAAATAQLLLPALARRPRWAALYVHLRNGLYANACFDRLVGALRPAASLTRSPR